MLNSCGQPDSPATTAEPIGDPSRFTSAAVVGAGLMGARLAGVLASRGMDVSITDIRSELLGNAASTANTVAAALGDAPGTVRTAPTVADAVDGADLVLEAVVENIDVKRGLFRRVARLAPDAVLATNSSVLRVTAIGADVENAERVVGTHWWNPPDLIPIVEVVQGEHTSTATVGDVMALLRQLGKTPVWVRRDTPGYVGNRIQHAMWREAIALVSEGVADARTIDLIVRNTIGLRLARMGPIENADYVGLDLTLAIQKAVLPVLSRATEPDALLVEMVAAGRLGAKSQQGFLPWPEGAQDAAAAALAAHVADGLGRANP
ncbi:3-hydroxyacyl-CoA dehydrogenase family protein [Amycolatopsis plumensis]|uniref:3-hydroxyacyl-CoA dehydrogenase family protein n=1 Tax=Amycolatopsis plumensis TaxID=236508 RepID=A0ABV5U8M8_9PSEU